MSNLPRESTKKQFKKLMKLSKKSKTNKMYGAFDTSKNKISSYEPSKTEHLYIKFKDFVNETFTNKLTIGIDIDGTINNFVEGYNNLYKKHFPDNEISSTDDWYWYKNMNYNGEDPKKWFDLKKSETFDLSQPYPNAVNIVNNIYDMLKSQGFNLNIVTYQPTNDSKDAAKKWLDRFGFKYDQLICVDSSKDKWKYVDILVDDSSDVIGSKPLSKVSIKIERPYNSDVDGDFNILNIENLNIDLMKKAISKVKNKTTL